MPKLLFVTSGDFGELANALYFLDGLTADARILTPPRLAEKNVGLSPPLSAYRSLSDLLAAIDAINPQALFLFSGYLFGVNDLLRTDDLARLLGEARRRSLPVVTTDPFLGLVPRLGQIEFRHPHKAAFIAHFARLFDLLRDVAHLYPSPLPPNLTVPAQCFYNPRLVATAQDRAAFSRTLSANRISPREPLWLFTLAAEDYVAQCATHGERPFQQMLLRLLADAVRANRKPILIAPQPVRAAIADGIPAGATALDFCSQSLFRALLLSAEHAFYWNTLSNSILSRVANNGSVFFFGDGHLSRALPAIRDLASACYYADATLPRADATAPLDPAALSSAAAAQPALFAPALTRFRALATPAQVLDGLLAEGRP